jgi:hypothetical protein
MILVGQVIAMLQHWLVKQMNMQPWLILDKKLLIKCGQTDKTTM